MNIDTEAIRDILSSVQSVAETIKVELANLKISQLQKDVKNFGDFEGDICKESEDYPEYEDKSNGRTVVWHIYDTFHVTGDKDILSKCDSIQQLINTINDKIVGIVGNKGGLNNLISECSRDVDRIDEKYEKASNALSNSLGGGNALVWTDSTSLNFREAPGTDSKVLKSLPKGSSVTVLEKPVPGSDGMEWVKIQVGGTVGYVAAKYLNHNFNKYDKIYTVESGDNLTAIATKMNKELGTDFTYEDIAKYNHIVDPNYIAPGQIIRIPSQTSNYEYKYFDNGRIKQEIVRVPSSATETVHNYDEEGNEKSCYVYSYRNEKGDKQKDGQKTLDKVTHYNSDDNSSTTIYYSNHKKTKIENTEYDSNGIKRHAITQNYDSNGNVTTVNEFFDENENRINSIKNYKTSVGNDAEEKNWYKDGNVICKNREIFSQADGHLMEQEIKNIVESPDGNGIQTHLISTFFGESNNITQKNSNIFDENGKNIYSHTTNYDENGIIKYSKYVDYYDYDGGIIKEEKIWDYGVNGEPNFTHNFYDTNGNIIDPPEDFSNN